MESEIKTNNQAEATSTDKSVSVSYDNTIEASTGISTENENASISVEASAKTGTTANVNAGLDCNNVYAEVKYSDTTEAHVTVDAAVNYEGVGGSVSGDAYVKSGNEMDAHVSAGDKGVDVRGNVSCGESVGVDVSATVDLREASVTGGAGVSVGEHFAAGGGGQATFEDGQATVGVSGDVAALVGLEVDVSVTVDTNQIKEDANVVVEEAPKVAEVAVVETQKVAEVVVVEAPKIAEVVVEQTQKVAEVAVEKTQKVAESTADSIKKFFRW